ncbi:MAG: HAD-IC family P-type ATPase, partial [Alphaproteobacteria bacterium]|nr:HAD-IC family P-type ATPase [Alphaproteobacteria bacterium]
AKLAADVREIPGEGLEAGPIRLGSRRFVGVADEDGEGSGPELWLARPGRPPLRFCFRDQPRPDAAPVVAELRRQGFALLLASGDRRPVVAAMAEQLGIEDWRAGQTPSGKCALLDEQAARGRRVLMVGDGLNDAPALAAAHVSLSPSTAVDVSQTAADVVFQGLRLGPVVEAIAVARRADRLVKQNFVLAFLYNVVTVPLAVMGLVTPLIAAIAMSTSSVVVIANALRLAGRR